MNPGKIPSAVTNSATKAATNAPKNLNGVANAGATNVVKGQSSLGKTLPDIETPLEDTAKKGNLNQKVSQENQNKPNNSTNTPEENVNTGETGNPEGSGNQKGNPESGNQPENPQNGSNNKKNQANPEEVGPGKKIDENGNVVNTGTRKSIEAIGRVGAAYATHGESIGNEDIITKNPIGDKAIGVVADTADKIPVAGQVLNDLGESGVADGVNDALDTVGNAKKGDIKGTVDSAKKTVKDVKKVSGKMKQKLILGLLTALSPILICVVFGAICAPILGGFLDVTSEYGEETDGSSVTNGNTAVGDAENIEQIIGDADQLISGIPGYDSLDEIHKGIVTAAAMGVSSGRPYLYGGKPTGPGLAGIPSTGVDCSGFVGWSIWTATNQKPSAMGTSQMISSIGGMYEEISASELQPGDIGLKHKNSGDNHTGVYAGNGSWFHAAGSKTGIVKSNYSGFTVYLRYKGAGAA